MFEKVVRGREDRRPPLQWKVVSASLGAHALVAAAIVAMSFTRSAVVSRTPVEKATLLVLYNPEKDSEAPASAFERTSSRERKGTPEPDRRRVARRPAPRKAEEPRPLVERVLPPPVERVGVLPLSGESIDSLQLRGIGDVAMKLDGGSPSLDPGGGGDMVGTPEGSSPLVDAAMLAVPPSIINRREISELMSMRYPEGLKFRGIEGQVVVAFIIGTDGKAEMDNVLVLSATNRGFVRPALEGLRRMRFRPAELDGVRVRVRASLPLMWVLSDAPS